MENTQYHLEGASSCLELFVNNNYCRLIIEQQTFNYSLSNKWNNTDVFAKFSKQLLK